jgi:RHS repeat-associated protein
LGNWAYVENGITSATLKQDRNYNLVNEINGLKTYGLNLWTKPRYDQVGNTTRIPRTDNPTQPIRIDYDAWNRPTWIYVYDASWNRLKVALYSYDGLGRRITELRYQSNGKDLSERLDHYYDDQWRVAAIYSSSVADVTKPLSTGTLIADYLWGQSLGGYVDSLVLRNTSLRLYALQDAHYNAVALADTTGTIVERFAYSAFGQVVYLDSNFDTVTTSANNWINLFAGRPQDLQTSISNVRHRDYASIIGRWTSRDPIGEKEGLNLYSYTMNNPINLTDPQGLISFDGGWIPLGIKKCTINQFTMCLGVCSADGMILDKCEVVFKVRRIPRGISYIETARCYCKPTCPLPGGMVS